MHQVASASTPGRRLPKFAAPLRHVGFRDLHTVSVVVTTATLAQTIGRGWLARDLSGSNAGLGGVLMAFGLALLLATPIGGLFADVATKRTVLALSIAGLLTSSVVIALAISFGSLSYLMLVAASAIQGVGFGLFLPARMAFIPELVPPPIVGDAVVLGQVNMEAMRLVAPALAGILIGVPGIGVGGVYWSSTVLCALVAPLVLRLPATRLERTDVSQLGGIADAVRYIRSSRMLTLVVLVTVAVVMITFPYLAFLPTIAEDRFDRGATGLGLLSASCGLGALLGGVASRWRFFTERRRSAMVASGVVLGASMIALGASPTFWLSAASLVVAGFAGLLFQTTTQTLLLALSVARFHGRLQSTVILGFSGFGLAALPLGLLADATSLPLTLSAMGSIAVLTALAFGRWSRHQPDDQVVPEGERSGR